MSFAAVLRREACAMATDPRPPNIPWQPLLTADPPTGYASIYYSDDISPVAVREVTRPRDNKSDPNLETLTYGLFSTCERAMRAGIVARGIRYIFFITRRRGLGRVVTGYYDLGWHTSFAQNGVRDHALAARRARFIHPPLQLSELPVPLRKSLGSAFRLCKRLGPEETRALVDVLHSRPDATARYLSEIDRLERLNKSRTGYRCWRRLEPFTWGDAVPLLAPIVKGTGARSNRSPSGWWTCAYCNHRLFNQSRLRLCPGCGGLETFIASD